jgi:phytoene/squalene synthetase
MSPDEYCQQKAAQSGSSFYYSFLFLPAERRKAITALYAFCREVDDTVDVHGRRAVHQAGLVAQGNQGHVRGQAHAPGDAGAAAAPGRLQLEENTCRPSSTAWKWT